MEAVLNSTYQFVLRQILVSGDGQLPQDVDPFWYDLNEGAYFECESFPGQHLTWGILGATAGWLHHHLGEQAAYKTLTRFQVYDGPWGLIARGRAWSGYTGKGVPQVVAGSDGVAHYS